MLARWLNKFRSLYADPVSYQQLSDGERVRPWLGSAVKTDREYSRRTAGKILLDLGCGPPDARGAAHDVDHGRYIGLDFLVENHPSVVASVDHMCLRDNSVDSINCISLLEHVYNPLLIIGEIFRVLRPGGCVRIQVPFLLGYHGFPDDYFRYTHSALKRMFEGQGFRIVLLETDWSKGPYLNAAQLLWHGSWGYYQPRWRFLTRLLSQIMLKLSSRLDGIYARDDVGIYHAVILLAEKPADLV